jgi:F-box protein 11
MSYVRFDDQHDNGRLTQFRERLSGEVRIQTGEEFPIFQDRNDILWGQNWKERVEESLDQVTFLIPIVTPSFFLSPACRSELEQFIDREKQLDRNDLILPVYYVGCPLLNDQERRAEDALAEAIAAHQYADWRELRFEPFTSPEVGKMLVKLAVQVRDARERVGGPLPASGMAASRAPRSRRRSRPACEQAEASERVA